MKAGHHLVAESIAKDIVKTGQRRIWDQIDPKFGRLAPIKFINTMHVLLLLQYVTKSWKSAVDRYDNHS